MDIKKQQLLNFIRKYNLGGLIETVIYNLEDETLSTNFSMSDKTMVGDVLLKQVKLDDPCELGIYNTTQLLKIIEIFDDTIELKFLKSKDKYIAIKFKDSNMNAEYMLAEKDIILKPFKFTGSIDFDAKINLDKSTIDRILKSISALSNADNFYIKLENNTCVLIVSDGINKIKVNVDSDITEDFTKVMFPVNLLKNIITFNKDFDKSEFKISSKGISHISFSNDLFESNYYLTAKQIG